jgi:Mor family transcriptional regulator
MKYDVNKEDLPADIEDLAEIIGLQGVLDLANHRGGETLYIPKIGRITRAARDRSIRNEFNGSNYKELARKHKLSTVWIRKIVDDY